jgi:hypothetical protein
LPVYQHFEKSGLVRKPDQVDASLEGLFSFKDSFGLLVNLNGINNRIGFSKIVAQVNILVLVRLKGDGDLVAILGLRKKSI